MDPPKCRLCGEKHWSPVCNGDVAKPATKPVAATPSVASKTVPSLAAELSCATCVYLKDEVRRSRAEIEALQAEVAMLKRKLAEANTETKVAMTATERSRRLRAKRKSG